MSEMPEKKAAPPPSSWWNGDETYYQIGETFVDFGVLSSAYYFGKGVIQHQPPTIAGAAATATATANASSSSVRLCDIRGRVASGVGLARGNAFRVAGASATAIGVYSVIANVLEYKLGKEYYASTFVAAAIGGAAVNTRRGPLFASKAAIACGAFGLIAHIIIDSAFKK